MLMRSLENDDVDSLESIHELDYTCFERGYAFCISN